MAKDKEDLLDAVRYSVLRARGRVIPAAERWSKGQERLEDITDQDIQMGLLYKDVEMLLAERNDYRSALERAGYHLNGLASWCYEVGEAKQIINDALDTSKTKECKS